jgi:hypothetical protein
MSSKSSSCDGASKLPRPTAHRRRDNEEGGERGGGHLQPASSQVHRPDITKQNQRVIVIGALPCATATHPAFEPQHAELICVRFCAEGGGARFRMVCGEAQTAADAAAYTCQWAALFVRERNPALLVRVQQHVDAGDGCGRITLNCAMQMHLNCEAMLSRDAAAAVTRSAAAPIAPRTTEQSVMLTRYGASLVISIASSHALSIRCVMQRRAASASLCRDVRVRSVR